MTTKLPKKTTKHAASHDTPASLTSIDLRPAGLTDAEVDVFRQLLSAITDRRLSPGVKLTEEELSSIFKVSRERIRRVLLVMSQHGIISLEPNRGASVARPSPEERRHAFATRRILEVHVVEEIAAMRPARRAEIGVDLRQHLAKEDEAIRSRDRSLQIRLSGEFHIRLAAHAGNSQVLRVLQELQALLSLALAMHPNTHSLDCSISEHQLLVETLVKGDSDAAVQTLLAHLNHLEENMQDTKEHATPLQRALAGVN